MQKNNENSNNAANYKLGYYQGISDVLCEISKIGQNLDSLLIGEDITRLEKRCIHNAICTAITQQVANLMQKNGKNDFYNCIEKYNELFNKK